MKSEIVDSSPPSPASRVVWPYDLTGLALGLAWYIILLVPEHTRYFLTTTGWHNFHLRPIEMVVLMGLASWIVARIGRTWIMRAKGWRWA